MRIAILLSGIPKLCNKSYDSIQAWFPGADIFIHVWDVDIKDVNEKTAYAHNTYKEVWKVSDVLAKFSPKKHCVENFAVKNNEWMVVKGQYEKDNILISQHSTSMLSMFYGLYEVSKLKQQYEKENNFKYDMVVRMRFDSDVSTWENQHEGVKNTLHIPEGRDYAKDGINDQFCFGDSDIMNMTCDCYPNLDDIVQSTKLYNPEFCFAEHLRRCKILPDKVERIKIDVNINHV